MDAAESLIIQNREYVRSLARGIAKKLPAQVDFEELVAFGELGLVQAARNFKFGQGAAFPTYAYYRIRGAIFDGLRKMAGLPPTVRKQVGQMDAEDDVVQNTVPPSGALDDPEFLAKQFNETVARLGAVFLLSQSGDDAELEVAQEQTPADIVEQSDLLQRLAQVLGSLPPEQMNVVKLYYYERKSMAECADTLGVDKSTVSRLHTKAIESLRRSFVT